MIQLYQSIVNTPVHFYAKNCSPPLISSQYVGNIDLMTNKGSDRLTEAARWIQELNETIGLSFKSIAEKAEIPYTTLMYVKNQSGSDITSEVYNSIRRLYLERSPHRATETPSQSSAARFGLGVKIVDDDPPRAEVKIPETAREFYENFEFHGGKMGWLEMENEQRSFYENLHAMLVSAIDSANEKYAASLREIRAARDREIRAALEEFEKTFRKRMLGILGN